MDSRMPHTKLTDQQFRDLVVQRLDDGDRRFGLLEKGQTTMRAQIDENTKVTKDGFAVAKDTDAKVDKLIRDSGRVADQRHKENLDRFEVIGSNAIAAKQSAEKTQTDIAGLLAIYDGGKTGVKVVKGIAIGVKGIILYSAGVVVGGSMIVATALYWLGRVPQLPPLFGH